MDYFLSCLFDLTFFFSSYFVGSQLETRPRKIGTMPLLSSHLTDYHSPRGFFNGIWRMWKNKKKRHDREMTLARSCKMRYGLIIIVRWLKWLIVAAHFMPLFFAAAAAACWVSNCCEISGRATWKIFHFFLLLFFFILPTDSRKCARRRKKKKKKKKRKSAHNCKQKAKKKWLSRLFTEHKFVFSLRSLTPLCDLKTREK